MKKVIKNNKIRFSIVQRVPLESFSVIRSQYVNRKARKILIVAPLFGEIFHFCSK